MARFHRIFSYGAASVDFQFDDVAQKMVSIVVLNGTTRRWVRVEVKGVTRISQAVPPGGDWTLVFDEANKIPYVLIEVIRPGGRETVMSGFDFRVSCGA